MNGTRIAVSAVASIGETNFQRKLYQGSRRGRQGLPTQAAQIGIRRRNVNGSGKGSPAASDHIQLAERPALRDAFIAEGGAVYRSVFAMDEQLGQRLAYCGRLLQPVA